MQFAHDTETGLVAAAGLVSTASRGVDALATPTALTVFLDEHRFTGRRDGTDAELAQVHRLRTRLRALWSAEGDEVVSDVNELLTRTRASPRLVRHDGWDWHLHVTDAQAPLAERLGAEAAMALVDLVRAQELHRLRTCQATGCDAVLVDLSRNSSRRFCDTGCANRTHVAALRARRRTGASAG